MLMMVSVTGLFFGHVCWVIVNMGVVFRRDATTVRQQWVKLAVVSCELNLWDGWFNSDQVTFLKQNGR